MKPSITRQRLLRWSLFGLRAGLVCVILDFLIFFAIPAIREAVYGALGRLMEPLLLAFPLGVTGLSLIVLIVCYLADRNPGDVAAETPVGLSRPGSTRSKWIRRSSLGMQIGLAWAIFDLSIFFGIPAIRGPARAILGRLMEPLVLGIPAGVAVLSLIVWVGCSPWNADSPE